MPAKGSKVIPRADGDELRIRKLRIRDSDFKYLADRYGDFSKGVRELVTVDRRKWETDHFGKKR